MDVHRYSTGAIDALNSMQTWVESRLEKLRGH